MRYDNEISTKTKTRNVLRNEFLKPIHVTVKFQGMFSVNPRATILYIILIQVFNVYDKFNKRKHRHFISQATVH